MIYTVSQHDLVLQTAAELKNHIEMPGWAVFAKTGAHRETMPRNPDWWYIRAASILRLCYKQGPVGVNKLRTRYGGRQNRGMAPDRFAKASGKVIRTILQQLEKAKLLEQKQVGTYKGRVASAAGASILAKAAKAAAAKAPAPKTDTPKKVETKKEAPAPAEEKKETPAKEEAKPTETTTGGEE